MESFSSLGTQLNTHFGDLKKAQSCVTQSCETNSASYKETQSCVNTSCTVYEMIPKHEYGILLRQLEEWGTAYPKSICKIYGVKTVKTAVEYTKATPNVRNKGAYCLYMCRQLKSENKKEATTTPAIESKKQIDINTPKNDFTPVKPLKTIPEIKNHRDALLFVCDFNDGLYGNDENVVDFARKIKLKYNY